MIISVFHKDELYWKIKLDLDPRSSLMFNSKSSNATAQCMKCF